MEIPYKRRLRENSLKIKSTSSINTASKKIKNGASIAAGVLSRTIITFTASLAGAVIASFASIYFTLTTLESFKAEESLRQFAISDLYRPLREKAAECLSIRSNALGALASYAGLLKSLNGYANEYLKNDALRNINTSGAEVLIEPIIDKLGNFAKVAMEGQAAAASCQHVTNNMAIEAATVLGLNKKYEELRAMQIDRLPKSVRMMRDDDILMSIITNPSGTIALAMAINDGASGDTARMISAFSKLKSSLEKSLKQASSALKYEEKIAALAYKEDSERAQLFLSNLKNRFELTPQSTLSKSLHEAASILRIDPNQKAK